MNNADLEFQSGRASQDLVISLCGFLTSLLTAVILWWVESRFGVAIYSFTAWFVIPIGAILAGLAAASGYYASARLLNYQPTRLLLATVVLASVGTFFAIHYLLYFTMEVEGHFVRDYISFWKFLDVEIRSTSIAIRRGSREITQTDELGGLGYAMAVLQVAGFATGGILAYAKLTSIPYCRRCSRYLTEKVEEYRFTRDPEAMAACATEILNAFGSGEVAGAIEKHRAFGDAEYESGHVLRSVIESRRCAKCGRHWVQYTVGKKRDSKWKEISGLTAAGYTDESLDRSA